MTTTIRSIDALEILDSRGRMIKHSGFRLGGIDVGPARDDHVLQPACAAAVRSGPRRWP